MIRLATLKIALRALRRNSLRTLLTMLGIIIGVGAVIAMDSIGSGARAQLEASVASLGQNVITVMSGTVSRGGFRMGFGSAGTLTLEDFEAIRRELPGVAVAICRAICLIDAPPPSPKAIPALMMPEKTATSRPLLKLNSATAAFFSSSGSSFSLDIPLNFASVDISSAIVFITILIGVSFAVLLFVRKAGAYVQ